jgi:3-hexulose-6-phosphate synthase
LGRLTLKTPLLQVALDYTRLEDALALASRLRREIGSEGWLAEAGTPLIKAEGVRAISLLKSVVEPVPVVADMKTADTGELEASLACEHGASIVTVLALAPDETIESARRAVERCGGLLAADMLGVRDIEGRAEQLASLGVDILELHVGIDVQKKLGVTAAELEKLVSKLSSKYNWHVAVAGGLNEETAPRMAAAGASIVIVGGAITRSRDPVRAARRIIEGIRRAVGG